MRQLFSVAVTILILFNSCHLSGNWVHQSIQQSVTHPSCADLVTYAWVHGRIARSWDDNMCTITDSIITIRQHQAQEFINTILKANPKF